MIDYLRLISYADIYFNSALGKRLSACRTTALSIWRSATEYSSAHTHTIFNTMGTKVPTCRWGNYGLLESILPGSRQWCSGLIPGMAA